MNNKEMTREELLAQIAGLKSELKAKEKPLTLKVSKKGAISLYGLGRFPVTLYSQQWSRVIKLGSDITTFMNKNKSEIDRLSAITKLEKEAGNSNE